MELGLIGLGRMGANMARRLRQGGIEVVAFNRNAEVTQGLARENGLKAAGSAGDGVISCVFSFFHSARGGGGLGIGMFGGRNRPAY